MDSATADFFPTPSQRQHAASRTFQPRFDVREVDSSYELKGDLPGIEQKDLEIEFVDERTLVIRGRTASEETRTNAPAAESTKAVAANEEIADDVSEKSAKYRKPSVEEEDGYVDAGVESSADGAKTPASPTTVTAEQPASSNAAAASSKTADTQSKYWVSERSVGHFERRFSFPGRVDQEAVKASLKNGILSVVVPKIVAKEAKRIQVE